ncbi:MAG: hypothetical protein HZC55_23445 [Verrucomicrobia bacterium]|nr:hypothetical protein [Verrucomicrobiota bacterium]
MEGTPLTPAHPSWPGKLAMRLGAQAPMQLHVRGDPSLLAAPMTALLCSARVPGEALVRAYDQAGRWRAANRAVIGGFHSPLERACLGLLLRGTQPVILCPARALPVRITPDLRPHVEAGRLLLVSAFDDGDRRVTRRLAERRNLIVAALAEEVWFAHISPGGHMAWLARQVEQWRGRKVAPLALPATPGEVRAAP